MSLPLILIFAIHSFRISFCSFYCFSLNKLKIMIVLLFSAYTRTTTAEEVVRNTAEYSVVWLQEKEGISAGSSF